MNWPGDVSVTITVQIVVLLIGTVAGLQLIEIEVVLGLEVRVPLVPLLAEN